LDEEARIEFLRDGGRVTGFKLVTPDVETVFPRTRDP
jgi:hypothetical protein